MTCARGRQRICRLPLHSGTGLSTSRLDEFSEYHEAMPSRPQSYDVEREEGLLAGPRRLTNRAFDALDEMGDWVLGRRY